MKSIAIVKFGKATEAFKVIEAPTPVPKDQEVLIEVSCFGLNYADVMARKGFYRDCPPLPATVGYEVVGKIIATGNQVDQKRIGERVLAFTRFGGYSTHAIADIRAAVSISQNIPDAQATALATQYCTAYYAAEEMVLLHEGDTVLITAAAGGVGTALVQLCKRHKCIVVGLAGSDMKCQYILSLGADHAVNYSTHDFVAETKKILGKRKPDVIFDSIGATTYKKALRMLGAGGRIVGFGAAELSNASNKLTRMIKAIFGFGFYHPGILITKSKSLIGIYMLPLAVRRPDVLQRCLQNVVALAERGEIHPHVDKIFKATEIVHAHEYIESRKSVGKVAVEW